MGKLEFKRKSQPSVSGELNSPNRKVIITTTHPDGTKSVEELGGGVKFTPITKDSYDGLKLEKIQSDEDYPENQEIHDLKAIIESLEAKMPSDEMIRKAIIYGYNLTANASLAQIDVINYNIEVFIEDYIKQSQPKEEGDEQYKCSVNARCPSNTDGNCTSERWECDHKTKR